MDIAKTRQEAVVAYKSRNYPAALKLASALVPYCDPTALYICAVINETVLNDVEKAYYYYDLCCKSGGYFDSYNGCVRLILKAKKYLLFDKAVSYCETAIRNESDGITYLLLGRLYEELSRPPRISEAKKAYLKSAMKGSAWGMRRYSNIEYRYGLKILGLVYHIITTIMFPIYRLFLGKRALRSG